MRATLSFLCTVNVRSVQAGGVLCTFIFPQSRQHIIDSKLKLKLLSFVLFLECLHERFKKRSLQFSFNIE